MTGVRFTQDDVIASGSGDHGPWGVIKAQCVGVPLLATLPHLGLAVKVQYGKNPDFFCYCKEIHAVWEAMQESAVNFIFQSRKLQWILRDSLEHQVEFIKKPCAESGLLVLVPHGCCLDVEFRLRADD
jgi:hypothetical protein